MEQIIIGESIIFLTFSAIVLSILCVLLKKNKIVWIKNMQIGFIVFFIGEIILYLIKHKSTIGCADLDFNYKVQILFFFLTATISYFLYKKERRKNNIFLYTPILFIVAFIFFYISSQTGYIEIHESIARGGKDFLNRPECDFLLLRLLN